MDLIRHFAFDHAEKELLRAIYESSVDGIVFLVGMPGAGKSVLLRLVARLIAGDPLKWGKGLLPTMFLRAANTDRSFFSPKDFMARAHCEVSAPRLDWLSPTITNESLEDFVCEVTEARRAWEALRRDGSENAMRRAVENTARERGVKYFLIDQAGSITFVQKGRSPCEHMYSLMCLGEEVPMVLVLSGTPRIHRLWDGNAEIRRRSKKVYFGRYKSTSKEDLVALGGLCLNLTCNLNFDNNAKPENTVPFVSFVTRGVFGEVKGFYARAESVRIAEGSSRITMRHLEQAVLTQKELKTLFDEQRLFDSLSDPAKIRLPKRTDSNHQTAVVEQE